MSVVAVFVYVPQAALVQQLALQVRHDSVDEKFRCTERETSPVGGCQSPNVSPQARDLLVRGSRG